MTDYQEQVARWTTLPTEGWVAAHAPRFKETLKKYKVYAQFLEEVLKAACRKLAPQVIVTARPKGVASFAEKIIRKRKLYMDPRDPQPPDPLVRLTDLCGARVIAQTAEQVHTICQFIERAFDIDKPNSEDVSQRLKPTEFGYRSVHYIVQVNPEKLKASGIDVAVPAEVMGPVCPDHPEPVRLKAEIQVRTILEHASADIAHDLIYKTDAKVPPRIHRQYAALAAVLEGADREFGRLLASLHEFKSNFGPWHKPNDVQQEITRLRIVLGCDPDNEELAVRIGQLALAIGEHKTALDVLKPFEASRGQGVQRVRGLALTELHWETPFSGEFQAGMGLLKSASDLAQLDAETLCALAECRAQRNEDNEARKLFAQAIVAEPTEPLSFCRFLEFETAHHRNIDMVRLTEPMIRQVMERCHKEIQAGVNLPVAWSCLSVFQLLTNDPFAAIESLMQVLTLCGKPNTETPPSAQPCAAGRVLRRTQQTLQHLDAIRKEINGFDWFERALLLGLATLVKDEPARIRLKEFASWGNGAKPIAEKDKIVILSGGCAPEVQEAVNAFSPHLHRAVENISFTLFSGGTRMGISGLAGDVAASSKGRIRAFGYLPSSLPFGVAADTDKTRFQKLLPSAGKDFSPLDPLQGWTDLIAANVKPQRVKVISYAGGHISRIEYAVALALGAQVGMIESLAIPPARRFNNALWQGHPNLLLLPLDAMTIHAFLQMGATPVKDEDKARFEKAAQIAHADYVKSARPKDPSLQDWKDLPESLKLSNYHQVAFWERVLLNYGLAVRPLPEGKTPPLLDMTATVGEEGVRKLAEIEHGRWNVERIFYGWRYAEEKDVLRKLNPCLVPWPQLTNIKGTNYQDYDIAIVLGLPKKLAEAGLEIYKC